VSKKEKGRKGVGEDPFDLFGQGFDAMRSRMDRILEDFMSGDLADSGALTYGFSMRVGPDGVPSIQEFGDSAPPERVGEDPPPQKEPLLDIFESEDHVTVIMELPGMGKQEIEVNASGRTLDLEVDSPQKRFSKRLELPCEVLSDSAQASYKNGVLQVVLKRAAAKKKIKPIKAE
jgi:HSP20 family protein